MTRCRLRDVPRQSCRDETQSSAYRRLYGNYSNRCLVKPGRSGERSPRSVLTALAHELASDGILENAGKLAHAEMHKALDTFQES